MTTTTHSGRISDEGSAARKDRANELKAVASGSDGEADVLAKIDELSDEEKKGSASMAANDAMTESGGFSAEERAAMKERAAELRAEGKKGATRADGLRAVLDSIAEMAPEGRALAERVHVTVTATAPELSPKTWYGMPAYANAEGKVVVFFQDAGKFKYRYSTLGFQEAATLDDGDMWPVSYALQEWSPVVEAKVVQLLKAAIS